MWFETKLSDLHCTSPHLHPFNSFGDNLRGQRDIIASLSCINFIFFMHIEHNKIDSTSDAFRSYGDVVSIAVRFSIVFRLYVVHSETKKQKRAEEKKKKTRVTTRKRDEARGISVISLSEVYPFPDRYRVSVLFPSSSCLNKVNQSVDFSFIRDERHLIEIESIIDNRNHAFR
jgi:hypothetical protein